MFFFKAVNGHDSWPVNQPRLLLAFCPCRIRKVSTKSTIFFTLEELFFSGVCWPYVQFVAVWWTGSEVGVRYFLGGYQPEAAKLLMFIRNWKNWKHVVSKNENIGYRGRWKAICYAFCWYLSSRVSSDLSPYYWFDNWSVNLVDLYKTPWKNGWLEPKTSPNWKGKPS